MLLISRDYSYARLSIVVPKELGADSAANVQVIESVVTESETIPQSQPKKRNLETSDAI